MSYKILSLDGGGSWALIQARVLQDIYGDIRGHELLRQFDMVIANSGGSLVLASLCNDMLLSEIISVFRTEQLRVQVFSKLSFWEKLKWRNILSLTSVLGPKYSMERKLTGLINVLTQYDHLFKEKKISKTILTTPLNELPAIIKKESLQLLIVGFDYFKERSNFFRSNPKSLTDKFSFGNYYQISLVHAIHASSNAPINYFDAPAQVNTSWLDGVDQRTSWYWDGGVSGFNNPVLAGLIEAMTNNHGSPKDYSILSIGTATASRAIINDYENSTNPTINSIYQKNKDNELAQSKNSSTFFKDVEKLSKSILGDPPDSASFIAYSIIDPSLSNTANFVRINPCLKPVLNGDGLFEIPEVYRTDPNGRSKFIALLDLDMDAVKQEEVDLISDLCDKFIISDASNHVPNQLIRGGSTAIASGQPNYFLGYGSYQEAKAKWMTIK